ncbi:hypothetical protein ACWGII_40210 [Streptomyces sp. NPDC054855]
MRVRMWLARRLRRWRRTARRLRERSSQLKAMHYGRGRRWLRSLAVQVSVDICSALILYLIFRGR